VTAAGSARVERAFASDHPAARGHFEGNPIIPGALLLSETILAIEPAMAGLLPMVVTSAKFLHPARPGDRVVIEFSRSERGEVRFNCAVGEKTVLTGQMSCRAQPTAR
jgi:3-hydroxyacyl-[acyl-carrier-protein] dehydratase